MVHSAIYDAVSTIDGSTTLYTAESAVPGASPEAALAAAAHRVLSYLYPAQQTTLDAALTSALAKAGDGPAKADGITLGTAVGNAIIALRSTTAGTTSSRTMAARTSDMATPRMTTPPCCPSGPPSIPSC